MKNKCEDETEPSDSLQRVPQTVIIEPDKWVIIDIIMALLNSLGLECLVLGRGYCIVLGSSDIAVLSLSPVSSCDSPTQSYFTPLVDFPLASGGVLIFT